MKYQYSKKSKTFKLQMALMAGDAITAAAAEKRFGIKNLSAEVSRIRDNGYAIYKNNRKAGNHVEVTEYVMGDASREMIALAYKAKRLGITV